MIRTLERRFNQVIKINDEISITVLQFENGKVSIGVQAPKEVPVIRCKITDYRIPPSQRAPGERYPEKPAAEKKNEQGLRVVGAEDEDV